MLCTIFCRQSMTHRTLQICNGVRLRINSSNHRVTRSNVANLITVMDVRWTWCHVAGDTVSAFVRTVVMYHHVYYGATPVRNLHRVLALSFLFADPTASTRMPRCRTPLIDRNALAVKKRCASHSRILICFVLRVILPFFFFSFFISFSLAIRERVFLVNVCVGWVLVFQCTFSNWITFWLHVRRIWNENL